MATLVLGSGGGGAKYKYNRLHVHDLEIDTTEGGRRKDSRMRESDTCVCTQGWNANAGGAVVRDLHPAAAHGAGHDGQVSCYAHGMRKKKKNVRTCVEKNTSS